MTSKLLLPLALGLSLVAGAASAQSLAALQRACGADIKALCAGVQPGGGRIKQCMLEQSEKISPACKEALAVAAAARANAAGK